MLGLDMDQHKIRETKNVHKSHTHPHTKKNSLETYQFREVYKGISVEAIAGSESSERAVQKSCKGIQILMCMSFTRHSIIQTSLAMFNGHQRVYITYGRVPDLASKKSTAFSSNIKCSTIKLEDRFFIPFYFMHLGNSFGYNNGRIHGYILYVEKIQNRLHGISQADRKNTFSHNLSDEIKEEISPSLTTTVDDQIFLHCTVRLSSKTTREHTGAFQNTPTQVVFLGIWELTILHEDRNENICKQNPYYTALFKLYLFF